ncbi:MAG: methylthioribose-1-phosphate isomerase [Myxococcota bacterium]|jgi:methylthioribose-1-phosphate isomerase
MQVNGRNFRTVWAEQGDVCLIDQPKLPHRFGIHRCHDHRQTADAIRTMVVRGAGAIGATAGHGMAQAALEAPDHGFHAYVAGAARTLEATRPTAQNLFYAVRRVLAAIAAEGDSPDRARLAAVAAAAAIADEDAAACQAIGEQGRPLLGTACRVSTHCNAGWLAFVDWGSALSPVYAAHRDGADVFVWVDETRPRSQGARLTAWELAGEGVPHSVVADNATAHLLASGRVDCVIVGADRVARNGDVANKIGT